MDSQVLTQTAELLNLTSSARIYDLSQPTHSQMPQLPGAPRYTLALLRRHGDAFRNEGLSTANELVVSICHAGTHIDALGHVSVDGVLHGGVCAAEAQTGLGGLQSLGIESAPLFLRRGVLLDAAKALGVDALAPAQGVDADVLQACATEADVTIGPGDVVLVRTGWGQYWNDADRYTGQGLGLAGVSLDGATWLAERGISATGADCLMYESFRVGVDALPVHAMMIQKHGIYLVENVNLEALSRDGISTFVIVMLPLALVGATGSPVRPIAVSPQRGQP